MSAVRSPLNRTEHTAFLDALAAEIAAAEASGGPGFGLLLVQLSSFDELNLALGYGAVDALMLELASRLERGFEGEARCLRVGTKKFALVLGGAAAASHAWLAASKVKRLVHGQPLHHRGRRLNLELALGIALCPAHADSAEALLQCAESALRTARGSDGIALYSAERTSEVRELHRVEVELVRALEDGGVEAFFQPQIDLRTGAPVGAEALLRCRDADGGFLPPELVIRAAGRARLLAEVTAAVLNTALRHASDWPSEGLALSFNVSPHSLKDRDFAASVATALRIWDWPAQALSLEITESAFMDDPDTSLPIIRGLRQSGMRVSIDDFGTGYSSLAYFKNIPANELKVDKSFVLNMRDSDADRRIVQAVVDLAHQFDLEVVAEGVENEETLEILRAMGCDIAQGYWVGKPMPPAAFLDWLRGRGAPGL